VDFTKPISDSWTCTCWCNNDWCNYGRNCGWNYIDLEPYKDYGG
jgi:hypothetical protein